MDYSKIVYMRVPRVRHIHLHLFCDFVKIQEIVTLSNQRLPITKSLFSIFYYCLYCMRNADNTLVLSQSTKEARLLGLAIAVGNKTVSLFSPNN